MSESVAVYVNDRLIRVKRGTSVAAAILSSGETHFRSSVTGSPRGALCGMGVCFECRVTIDGKPHMRSCQAPCADDMRIATV